MITSSERSGDEQAGVSAEQAFKATLNILEDIQDERTAAAQSTQAVLNILEDFDEEKNSSHDVNLAVLNILEDLAEEQTLTKSLNAQLEQRVLERTSELAQSEQRFRLLIEGVTDHAIFMLDPLGTVVTWNAGAQRLKGYTAAEIVGHSFACFYPEEDQAADKPAIELSNALRDGSYEDEGNRVRQDGSQFVANVVITAVYDETGRHLGFAKITRDITERLAAETQRLEALRREVLLKEIHHRVKNNLQVISSLLFLQSSFVKDGATLEILRESQTRVKSIALIHEKLYRSTDLAQLDFGEYVRDLIADLFRTYSVNQEAVTLRTTIEDVFLQIDTAIPCGLIINELISNAFKHAFPAGTRGCVEIQLKPVENGEFLLTVRDDGVGLPAGFDWKKAKSFGLQLVTDLTSQMDGTVELNTDCGTLFEIRFRDISQVEGEAL